MLTLLKIQNLALIDHLEWEPGRHLTSITGETGAGKSVIIGALNLILGERADKSVIRSGETTCSVEALFDLEEKGPINAILDEAGIPPCEDGQLILKRIITPISNKQFVNNSPATLSLLKALGEHLIDLHGPHDHQSLLAVDKQLQMLDTLGETRPLYQEYTQLYKQWQSALADYKHFKESEQLSALEIELLTHQVREIEEAELTLEEEQSLEEKWQRARNAAKLMECGHRALALIGGESGSLLDLMRDLNKEAQELERLDPSTESFLSSLPEIFTQLEDVESACSRYLDRLEIDPSEAGALEQRLNLLENIKHKYGPSLQDVLTYGTQAREKLDNIEHRQEILSDKLRHAEELEKQLISLGKNLSKQRRKKAPDLARSVESELKDLGFRQSAFSVEFIDLHIPGTSGIESIEFHISPNPGEPLKPLKNIASSGEMARIMLALKTCLAQQDATPLLVFDEIDANVGGEIARRVGEKMAHLGHFHQVISITHFPQVAALSHHHYLVEKNTIEGRTLSHIREIKGEARIAELVRMLGGGGDSTRKHAEELLSRNQSHS